jgi:heme O synthase-like polyprenyltransferase
MSGAIYFTCALALTAVFLGVAIRFALTRAVRDARRLFFTSITYLPLLWVAMILNRT